jgi:hypothetical protein
MNLKVFAITAAAVVVGMLIWTIATKKLFKSQFEETFEGE